MQRLKSLKITRPVDLPPVYRMVFLGVNLLVVSVIALILSQVIDSMEFFLWSLSTYLLGFGLAFLMLVWVLRMKVMKEPLALFGGLLAGLLALWFLDVIGILDLWTDFLSSVLVNLAGGLLSFGLILVMLRQFGLIGEITLSDDTALVPTSDETAPAAVEADEDNNLEPMDA